MSAGDTVGGRQELIALIRGWIRSGWDSLTHVRTTTVLFGVAIAYTVLTLLHARMFFHEISTARRIGKDR